LGVSCGGKAVAREASAYVPATWRRWQVEGTVLPFSADQPSGTMPARRSVADRKAA
jgi:hypothetical protein